MDTKDVELLAQIWGRQHPEWKPFYASELNCALAENWLTENNMPLHADSLTAAFETLAASGAIRSVNGSPAPNAKHYPRGASVRNPDTPAPAPSGPSATDLEYRQFFDTKATYFIKERAKRDAGFCAWLEHQMLSEVHQHQHAAPPRIVDTPVRPDSPKRAPGPWRLVEVQDAPRAARFPHGVKIALPDREKFVAEVDTSAHTLALTSEPTCGKHFSIGDGRRIVKELSAQNEHAELR